MIYSDIIRDMNEQQRIDYLATTPEYKRIVTELFPYWMSLTPGGKNFKPNMDWHELDLQIDRWDTALEVLYQAANEIGITIAGTVYRGDNPYDLDDGNLWEDYLFSDKLRATRNVWKKVMKRHGWDCSDATWRSENRDLSRMPDEWANFREAYFSD